MAKKNASPAQNNWFSKARFGMFVHYGLSSLVGRHEWLMKIERMPFEEYRRYADRFTPRNFRPEQWAQLAKAAGMKYMVFTTRHHDGYSLYDSQVSDFTSTKTAARRDFVAEFVKACRKAGLKVGLYYSLTDWRWKECYKGTPHVKQHRKINPEIVDYVHAQVRELCTNYGKIDILWYDGPWPYDAIGWQSKKLNAMARKLQPGIMINDRAETPEDFSTPEQQVTGAGPGRMWEANMTLNANWFWNSHDKYWKSPGDVIGYLILCACGAGNFMLDIGPRPDGAFPQQAVTRLKEIGKWVKINGEAIHGSEPSPFMWQSCGLTTVKGNRIYFHPGLVTATSFHPDARPWSEVAIGGVKNRLRSATDLGTGKKINFTQQGDRIILKGLPTKRSGPCNNAVRLDVVGKPTFCD
jgi:alpha-L-fucosidase